MDNKSNIFIDIEKKGNGAKQAKDEVKDLKKNVQDINKTLSSAVITATLSKVSQKLMEAVKKSSDYIETLNLLDVAYNGNTKAVREFTKQYSEILNLDDSTLISSAAHFKVLSQSMGLATETGEKFAKLLTQMTLDVSSLYNIDFKKAQSALQYAVEGRGTSLKQRTGVSVLETSVQTTLDNLGIDAVVEDMNDAEKAIARLISMEYQLQSSQGDLARTIEAPANQFRVLGEQATMAGRNIGNIFLSAVANVLPYINGLMIALNKILAAIASLFGYSEGMFDFFDSGDVGSITDSFNDLGGAVSGVGSSADKTRKKLLGLRGFDRLNVIKTPTESKGSGGGGGGTGVNPKLLDAFDKMADLYDSKLEGVRTKATEISEQILKWLNFTKKVNPETGEIEWKFNGISGLLKNMWNSFKGLSTTGKVLVGLGLLKGLTSLWNVGKKFVNIIGKTGAFKAIKDLISPTKLLVSSIFNWTKANKSLNSGIKDGIDYWKLEYIQVKNADGSINKLQTNLNKAKVSLKGFVTGAASLYAVSASFKSMSTEGANALNVLGAIGGSIGTITSGIQVGAALGGAYGAALGGLVGILGTAVTAIASYKTETDKVADSIQKSTDKTNEYVNSIKKQKEAVDEDLTLKYQSLGVYEKLVQELKNLTGENGNVKKGYENRVQTIVDLLNKEFGANLEVKDGIIKNRDEELKKIDEVIQKKKYEYWLEANKEKYIIALQNESDLYSEIQKTQSTREKAENNLAEAKAKLERVTKRANAVEASGIAGKIAAEAAIKKQQKAVENAQIAVENAQKAESNATKEYAENQLIRVQYDDMVVANAENNSKKMEEVYNKSVGSYKNANGEYVASSEDTTNKITYDASIRALSQKKYNKEIYDDFIKNLKDQSKAIEDITPEQATKWRALADTNEKEFMTQMKKLPQDVRQEIVDKMYEQGYRITEEMQRGIDVKTPKIKITADTSDADRIVNSFTSRIGNKRFKITTSASGDVKLAAYASGGLPSVGQMFIANERGPELVGQIGGQSFVANQNQMLDIIDKKLQSAGGGVNNATFIIKVGSEEIGKTVLRDLNKMARTNGQTITIGG